MRCHNNIITVNELAIFACEQKLTEDDEFSNVVFVKVDTDELEVGIRTGNMWLITFMNEYSCVNHQHAIPAFVFLCHQLLKYTDLKTNMSPV